MNRVTPARSLPEGQGLDERVFPGSTLIVLAAFASIEVVALGYRSELSRVSVDTAAALAVLGVAGSWLALKWVAPNRAWSAGNIYLLTFALFHAGLAAVDLGPWTPSDAKARGLATWFRPELVAAAFVLVGISAVALVVGYALLALFRSSGARAEGAVSKQDAMRRAAARAGCVLEVAGVASWFFVVGRAIGLSGLLGAYSGFSAARPDLPLGLPTLLVGFGIILLASASPGAFRRTGLVAFGCFTLIALPLGLRGEVLFPCAAALVVAARRRGWTKGWPLLAGIVVMLSFVSVIGSVRQGGVSRVDLASLDARPTDALVELGGTLRAVTEAEIWVRTRGETLSGGTYVASVQQLIARYVPLVRAPDPHDPRLVDRRLNEQAETPSGIGSSPVAEGYANGMPALLLFFVGLGALLAWLDFMPRTPLSEWVVGLVLFPFLIDIRNGFEVVPFQASVGGLIAVGLAWSVGLMGFSRARRTRMQRTLRMGRV
ncbi:MAG TPA: O-antigen polysaccharide polymerase Wzy [Gemmatimonadaceae bacterium]|nr:O-antigen polysaccharide polymerase Wzy [Gemmatimonadaceae bacterium]